MDLLRAAKITKVIWSVSELYNIVCNSKSGAAVVVVENGVRDKHTVS